MNTDWQEVDIQQTVRMLVARMTAKVFMGFPACRDMEWLNLSIDFSIDLFTAAFTLRMFPPWTHFIVAHFIPARYRIKQKLQAAERIITPLIEKHDKANEARAVGGKIDEDDTLLNWMLDHGDDKERLAKTCLRARLF